MTQSLVRDLSKLNKPTNPKNLTRNILFGMFAGFVIATIIYYLPFIPDGFEDALNKYVFILGGKIFMNLLKAISVPLIFFSLADGIASLGKMANLKSISTKTIVLYMATTALAVSTSLLIGWILQPGSNYVFTASKLPTIPAKQNLYTTILNIFPDNIFQAFANNQILAVVLFAIIFGIAINKASTKDGGFKKSFAKINHVFLHIVVMIMSFAPIGVFCLSGKFVLAHGLDIFKDVAMYVVSLVAVLVFHAMVSYSVLLHIFTKMNPLKFFRKMKHVILFAFSTSSSAATIPVTLKTVTKDLGVNPNIASFVVPVGASINMDGTAIMQGMATIFIAQIAGVDLTFIQYLEIVLLAVIASIGTAAVPSAGLITLTIILQQFKLPLEAIGIILAVDRILDMIRTAVNVCGDASIAYIVHYTEKK